MNSYDVLFLDLVRISVGCLVFIVPFVLGIEMYLGRSDQKWPALNPSVNDHQDAFGTLSHKPLEATWDMCDAFDLL